VWKEFRRRLPSHKAKINPQPSPMMPSAAGTTMYETHIPSFMSVYDMDSTIRDSSNLGRPSKLSDSTHLSEEDQQRRGSDEKDSEIPEIHLHQHRESTSTQTSDFPHYNYFNSGFFFVIRPIAKLITGIAHHTCAFIIFLRLVFWIR